MRSASASDTSALPLHAARVVRFQVSEGTWLSLDISPDGETLVFELLGHLYTLPILGGKARRLTSGMAFNRQPRYSPDGRHIAFVSDRSGTANVWIADKSGRGAWQLSELYPAMSGGVTSPAWSPDGRTIVVSQLLRATRPGPVTGTQQFRWLLAAYDVRTARMRWVSDTAPDRTRPTLGAVFGPAGDVVYAAVDAHRPLYVDNAEAWRIARINLATGQVEPEMWYGVHRVGMRPAVSRDGRYLAYATSSGSRFGLRLRDLHTSRERWLVREVLDNPPFYAATDSRDLFPSYAFTPDSKALVVAYGGKLHRIEVLSGRSAVIPFIADVERELAPLNVHQFALTDSAARTHSIIQPALSPDGNWAAFSALDRIWVMELSVTSSQPGLPRRLTTDSVGEFYPSWSPDGKWIAYTTWVDGKGGAVWRAGVRLDGKGPAPPPERLTTDTAAYFNTVVSPNGARVVAVRARLQPDKILPPEYYRPARDSLAVTLVWVPVSGGSPQVVTGLTAEQGRGAHFPADQVYFTADPERLYIGLTSLGWTGKDRRPDLLVAGMEESPRQPGDVSGVLSPDRRRALLTRKFTLFELGLPARRANGRDTLDLEQAVGMPFGAAGGSAHRWGRAFLPWISWSADGRRVLFQQGGSLFIGDVTPNGRTAFARVDVSLMVPVDVPLGTLVLRGARIITMRGDEVIEHGDLVVRDNRIVALGRMGTVPIPGARVLDVSGTTILPGYVDLHDHLALPQAVHSTQCWQCLTRLAYGITAVRDPSPGFAPDVVFTYRERERAGDLMGPRIFSAGISYWDGDVPVNTLDAARDIARPNADYFSSETFKIYNYNAYSGRRTRQLLAQALTEQRLNATIHGTDTELDLTVAIDGLSGFEHPIPIRIYDDVATLIARSGTTYSPTFGSYLGFYHYMFHRDGGLWGAAKMRRFVPPSAWAYTCGECVYYAGPPDQDILTIGLWDPDNMIAIVEGATRIVGKGGLVGVGSHGNVPGLGYHYELWMYALGGMSNHDILRSATIVGATAIGHANDFGSLEPGKLADFQILDKNPLTDIHNTTSIRYVMKNGRLYQADDLTQIWPRQKPLAPIYLWDHEVSKASADSMSTTQQ